MNQHATMSFTEYDAVEHIDEVTAKLDWPTRYRQLEGGAYAGSIADLAGDAHFFFCERSSRTVEASGSTPPDTKIFMMISGGTAVVNGQEFNPNRMLLFEPGAEFKAVIHANSTVAQIGVSVDSLEPPASSEKKGSSAGGVSTQDLSSVQSKNLHFLFRQCFSDPNDIEGVFQAIRNIDVLSAQLSGKNVASKHSQKARQALMLAREYIEENSARPLHFSEICAYAGISQRTLERAFNVELGMSPERYIRALRLNNVHRTLRNPKADEDFSVTRAAINNGFNHLGRFSQQYKQLFGELPSETLARALQTSVL